MEKIRDKKRIEQMMQKGEINFLDPESGYKYSLCAVCPNDSQECSVTNFERAVGKELKITRITFYCPICNQRFDGWPENMFLR